MRQQKLYFSTNQGAVGPVFHNSGSSNKKPPGGTKVVVQREKYS